MKFEGREQCQAKSPEQCQHFDQVETFAGQCWGEPELIPARISQKPKSSLFIFFEPTIYIVLGKYKKLNSFDIFSLFPSSFLSFPSFVMLTYCLCLDSRLSTFPSSAHSSLLIDCLYVNSKPNDCVWRLRTLLPVACGASNSESKVHT